MPMLPFAESPDFILTFQLAPIAPAFEDCALMIPDLVAAHTLEHKKCLHKRFLFVVPATICKEPPLVPPNPALIPILLPEFQPILKIK